MAPDFLVGEGESMTSLVSLQPHSSSEATRRTTHGTHLIRRPQCPGTSSLVPPPPPPQRRHVSGRGLGGGSAAASLNRFLNDRAVLPLQFKKPSSSQQAEAKKKHFEVGAHDSMVRKRVGHRSGGNIITGYRHHSVFESN